MKTKTNHTNISAGYKQFRWAGITTLIAVYLLVLAGGIVRSTGSGMGCPDWPKCFGSWVPPTEVSQLPLHYKEDYSNKRLMKNERLSDYLAKFGFESLSAQIRRNPGAAGESDFNATKTWIEYINRLLGVVVGALIFLTLILSVPAIRTRRSLFYLSLITFLMVGLQGWIGSIVVSTNLLPGTITVHMLLAIVIILLLIYTIDRSYHKVDAEPKVANPAYLNKVLIVALAASTLQVLLGTQVREAIDQAMQTFGYAQKGKWIESLGLSFYIHRSFSLFILTIHLFLIYQLRKHTKAKGVVLTATWGLVAVVIFEILTGVVMSYFDIPAFIQPTHLFFAIVIIGIQFFILLSIKREERTIRKIYNEAAVIGAQA
jgi:cytochrome c oxidase assembly protein subunit 15